MQSHLAKKQVPPTLFQVKELLNTLMNALFLCCFCGQISLNNVFLYSSVLYLHTLVNSVPFFDGHCFLFLFFWEWPENLKISAFDITFFPSWIRFNQLISLRSLTCSLDFSLYSLLRIAMQVLHSNSCGNTWHKCENEVKKRLKSRQNNSIFNTIIILS